VVFLISSNKMPGKCHKLATTVSAAFPTDYNQYNNIGQIIICQSYYHSTLQTCLFVSLNWEVRQKITILVGSVSRGRGCFMFHRENIQLLGINVCFQVLPQHKHRQYEGVIMTRTPILHVRTSTTTCRIKHLLGK
jgi:hypothetical protein